MFIIAMPTPLHLRQLADVIYQTVMDDTVVAKVHLAGQLDWSISVAYTSGFLPLFWWMVITLERERERTEMMQTLLWWCTERKKKKMGKGSGHHGDKLAVSKSQANGCVPRARSGMHPGITASNLVSSAFCP